MSIFQQKKHWTKGFYFARAENVRNFSRNEEKNAARCIEQPRHVCGIPDYRGIPAANRAFAILAQPVACRDFGIHASAVFRRKEHSGHKFKDVYGHFREGLFFRISVNPALVSECYVLINMIKARYHAVVEIAGCEVLRSAK